MQKVVNLRLHAPQIVKNQTKKRRSAVNTRLCRGFNLLLSIGIMLFSLQGARSQEAKRISITIKEASIKSALTEVQKLSGVKFSYGQDISKYAEIKVTYDGKDKSVDEVVTQILKPTNLHAVKMDGYLVIEEKPAPQTTRSPNVQAGQGTGSLKGRIVEFETSQPLPGASLRIAGTQIVGQSNESGYYTLTDIPAGTKTLEVSFIGYQNERISVNVNGGREANYDVRLQGDNTLEEVTITAIGKTRAPVSHSSEKQVLQEIRAAQSVVSGISSQEISRSADRNAAEVVQKIAGVTVRDDKFIVIRGMNERYNLTYLNGNIAPSTELHSRAFALDLIPTRIIDRIMVYKSPAPDLMADMTGGAVKIFTKDAKTVKHFDVEFRTGFRQNTTFNKDFLTYQGGNWDWLGFDDGTRKLPSSLPGYGDFTRANISQKTYVETFSKILEYGKITALPPVQLNLNYYNTFRIAGEYLSVLSSLSYQNESTHLDIKRQQYNVLGYQVGKESQNTQSSQISLLQNFTYTIRDSSRLYFKNFLLQQGQNTTMLRNAASGQTMSSEGEWVDSPGFINAATRNRNILLSWTQRFLYSGNIGGELNIARLENHKLDWNLGYTYSNVSIPDQRLVRLQNNLTDLSMPVQSGRIGEVNYEQNWLPVYRDISPENNDPTKAWFGHISRLWTRNNETIYNGSVDYKFKLRPWATLRLGSYQQWKERKVFRRTYTVNEGDLLSSGYPPGGQIGSTNPDVDYNKVFWRQQDLGELWSTDYLRDDGTGLKVFDRTSGSDTYSASEQNNSGYLAASLFPFGKKLDIYGGLRVEYNRQKVAGAIGDRETGWNTPVFADLKATKLLPSLNVGYRPDNSWVVRAAYGRTLNRPEFRELSPYAELDYINSQQIRGNSELLFAKINNYDLRFEWYPHANAKGEAVSIGGFYKAITDAIERTSLRTLGSINGEGGSALSWISFQNADKASIYGVELDIRKNLDFIRGTFFRNLSIAANGSYIFSKVSTDTSGMSLSDQQYVVSSRRLQGQAPYQFNAGIYYDNAALGTKIAFIYNEVGERIYAAAVGSVSEVVVDPSSAGVAGSILELPRRQLDFSLTQRIISSLQAKFSVQNLLNQSIETAEDNNFTFKYEKVKSGADQGDPLFTSYRQCRFFLLTLTYGF